MNPCIKCGARDRNKKGDCRPCQAKHATKWRTENPEKVKNTNAKYYAKNSEKARDVMSKWHAANSKKQNAVMAKWRVANPELIRIYNQNYQASKRANGGVLSRGLAKALFKRQKGKCTCCQKPLGKNYHLDHIMPLSRGGANEDWNIQLLRAFCNISKGAKAPVDYMREKGFLI